MEEVAYEYGLHYRKRVDGAVWYEKPIGGHFGPPAKSQGSWAQVVMTVRAEDGVLYIHIHDDSNIFESEFVRSLKSVLESRLSERLGIEQIRFERTYSPFI